MFFGLDVEKLILIGVIAAVIMGPERLPQAAAWLARAVRQLRDWTRGARGRLKEEMGDDFDEIEWRKLDPRQYDPRRIIRDALLDDPAPRVQAPPVAPLAPHVATDAIGPAPRVASDPIGGPRPGAVRAPFGAPKPLLADGGGADDVGFPPLPDSVPGGAPAPAAPTSAMSAPAALDPVAAPSPAPERASTPEPSA